MLAIRRGETEGVLYFTIDLDPLRPTSEIASKIHKQEGDWTAHLALAIEDAWKRLLNTSIQGETCLELKQNADAEAIKVFRDNLQNVLLAPPAGQLAVLGIDPEFALVARSRWSMRRASISPTTSSIHISRRMTRQAPCAL